MNNLTDKTPRICIRRNISLTDEKWVFLLWAKIDELEKLIGLIVMTQPVKETKFANNLATQNLAKKIEN